MKISILIPCYNEELNIERCVFSCLNQTRQPDEVIIVNDSSTDNTLNVLNKFKTPLLKVVTTPHNMGNKSHAQEYGLQFVTGDIFITTDGDTILQNDFIEIVERDMKHESIVAVAGYVKSLKYNWITACRSLDYIVGQNIDKLAQDYMGFVYVIPGAAGVFRTSVFKEKMPFLHDTVAEDLDFTYRLHLMGLKIKYNDKAICYTQDPTTLSSYINQMRRWYGGGWQNCYKYFWSSNKLGMIFELSLMYTEGLFFSFLILFLPFINLYIAIIALILTFITVFFFGVFGAIKEKRLDILIYLPFYIFLRYINSWIFLEQFLKEVVIKRNKVLVWYKPDRVRIKI